MYQAPFSPLWRHKSSQVFCPSTALWAVGSLVLVLKIFLTFLLHWIICFLNMLPFSFMMFCLVFMECIFYKLLEKGHTKGYKVDTMYQPGSSQETKPTAGVLPSQRLRFRHVGETVAWLLVAEFTGCPRLQLVSTGMPRKPAEEQMMAGLLCAPGSSVIN